MLDSLDLNKYDEALSRGLCQGKGLPSGQMCIEAAICYALGLPHGDDPKCVSKAVRSFKINLNDSRWSSPKARADGLRSLGLAQLGSSGVIDDKVFTQQLALRTVNKLIPALFREIFPNDAEILELALQCENAVDLETARATARTAAAAAADNATASYASYASYAVNVANSAAASYASYAANAAAYSAAANVSAAAAYYAADAAADAASYAARAALATNASDEPDKYLKMSANMALDILKKLGSPGCQLLTR